MSQTKFTKGEWINVKADFSDFDIAITTQKRWDTSVVNIVEVTVDWNGELAAEQKANASLIAAAPDMYAMVDSLSNELHAMINEVNMHRAKVINTQTETEPDYCDAQSVHEAQLLLKKARGE